MTEENDLDFLGDDPLDRLLSSEIDLIEDPAPVLPTGSPQVGIDNPDPIPEATPQNMVCLRGPCRYYMEIPAYFSAGNTKGSLDKQPKMINRFCLKMTPNEDLVDSLVFDCNHWDPEDEQVVEARMLNRKKWLEKNNQEKWNINE